MVTNDFGALVQAEWSRTADIRKGLRLDEFVDMPNHVHGIIAIEEAGTPPRAATRERFGGPTSNPIPTIIRQFKAAVTVRINALQGSPGQPVWQRGYYERIIRNERELYATRQYIRDNPGNWHKDEEYMA
jgi:REP element-mobilizing transposase RayT